MNISTATAAVLCLSVCSAAAFSQGATTGARPAATYRYELNDSRWIQNDEARAVAILAKRRVDVLVVPFQVEGDSFDMIERSLMTRTVAAGLRMRSGLAVADPTLVERALGSAARTVQQTAIIALAQRVSAKTVVLGFVGHDNAGKYHVRVESFSTADAAALRHIALNLQGVPFSDTSPPYLTFRAHRDAIAESIGGTHPMNRATGATTAARQVPSSIDELEQRGRADVVDAAHLLQFLGVLHPQQLSDRARDGLFERSLLLLDGVPATAETRALTARAWGYLNRRPLALAQLKNESDDERALSALLNGDLDELTAAQSKIRSPIVKVIATLERERSRLIYGQAADKSLIDAMGNEHRIWAAAFAQALELSDPWGDHSNVRVGLALDAFWPTPKYSVEATVKAALAVLKPPRDYDIAQLAYGHVDDVSSAGESAADERPVAGDVAEVFRHNLIANVVADVQHLARALRKPDVALAKASEFEPLLADHPDFLIQRGWIESGLADERAEPEKTNLRATGYDHLRRGAIWAQGQTPAADRILPFHAQFFPGSSTLSKADAAREFFDSDWPNLPGWGWLSASGNERNLRLQHCVDYTTYQLSCLEELHDALALNGNPAAAAGLLAANRNRFVGNPQRINFLADTQRTSGNNARADDILAKAVAEGTTDWEPYRRIGEDLAKRGKTREAADIYLKYPGFKNATSANRVTLSNRAYDSGSLVYWAGEYEAARPLYAFAAGLETGSSASITSAVRLALLNGDLAAAMEATAQRARRYGDEYGLRDLMMLLAALGERDTAWSIFNGLNDKLAKPDFWVGALAIQRIEGASLQTIAEWSVQGARIVPRTDLDLLAMRHIFLSQATDRVITDELATTLRARDPSALPMRDTDGFINLSGRRMVASEWWGDPPPRPKPGSAPTEQRLDSRLTMAARALAALERKDYSRAFEVFDEMSRVYDLREFLPYFAWAAANAGNTERIERYLTNIQEMKRRTSQLASSSIGIFFDEYMSLAALKGFRGDVDTAIDYLVRANADVLHTESRAIFTRYEIAEIAELVYDRTREKRYRDFILNHAQRNAKIDPVSSWPYGFVAKYSDNADERKLALARALYLDPLSKRALGADPKEIDAARRMIAAGNPMLPSKSSL